MRPFAVTAMLLLGCADADPYSEGQAAYARADYAAARVAYEHALASGDTPRAQVEARLGLTLRKLGENDAARRVLVAAVAGAEASGDAHLAAVARRYLGRVHADTGRYDEAMAAYDAALLHHRTHGPEGDVLKVQIQRAGVAWERFDFDTASDAYQDVHGRAVVSGRRDLEASALEGMSMLLGYVGDFGAARRLLGQAARLHQEQGRENQLLATTLQRAIVAQVGGDDVAALALGREALERARAQGVPIFEAQALVVLADASLDASALEEGLGYARSARKIAAASGLAPLVRFARVAEARATTALTRWDEAEPLLAALRLDERSDTRALAESLSARMADARGDTAGALRHLRAAVANYEQLRGELGAERLSRFFNSERTRAYERLVESAADTGTVHEAMYTVARIKARALSDTLRATPAEGERRRWRRGANLTKVLSKMAPVPPIESALSELPRALTVVEYYVLPRRLLVFTVQGGRARVKSVPIGRLELAGRVEALLAAMTSGALNWEAEAAWLAERLLDPVDDVLRAATGPITFIPHGALHQVPFAALPWAERLLVDANATFSAPSLAALHAILRRPKVGAPTAALAVGDPRADLPGARAEVQAMAAGGASPRTDVLIGGAATESAVRRGLVETSLAHFAVHGVRTSPERPAHLALLEDSKHDGRLHADEIAALDIDAGLVVLSVCDSARGRANRGDEVIGVVDRAFLEAGARSVLASRWPVHDAASVLFMRRFYAELPARGALGAFHAAQRALRNGEMQPSDLGQPLLAQLGEPRVASFRGVRGAARPLDLRHPYFWAAFTLRGDFR